MTKACHVRYATIPGNDARMDQLGGHARDRNGASRSELCRAGNRRRSKRHAYLIALGRALSARSAAYENGVKALATEA